MPRETVCSLPGLAIGWKTGQPGALSSFRAIQNQVQGIVSMTSPSTHWILVPAIFSAIACSGDDFTVEVSIHPNLANVVVLNWTTDDPGLSRVEYGLDDDYGMSTPVSAEESTEHRVLLLGLPPLNQVYFKAITEVNGVELQSIGDIATDNVPASLPDISVNVLDQAAISSEPYLLGVLEGIQKAIFAVDREGNWLWYYLLESPFEDGYRLFSEVYFALDGNDLFYNTFSTDLELGAGALFRVSIEADPISDTYLDMHHHAFTELPDGTIGYLTADVRSWYDPDEGAEVPVVGDAVYELAPDGSTALIFSTWDWMEPEKHDNWEPSVYDIGFDWTHGNMLEYYADSDTYMVSLGYVNTVLQIDRSGTVLDSWGQYGDVQVADGTSAFEFQHDPSWTDEGTLLMVATEDSETRGTEYSISGGTMEETWSYGRGEGILAVAQGQARRLANGNTMIGWGTAGLVREVTPEGEVVWELEAGVGAGFVQVHMFNDFYSGQ